MSINMPDINLRIANVANKTLLVDAYSGSSHDLAIRVVTSDRNQNER